MTVQRLDVLESDMVLQKIIFAITILILALAPVGAQDVATVTHWMSESSSALCRAEVYREFNELDASIQVNIVPQADTWNVTRTAVAGGGVEYYFTNTFDVNLAALGAGEAAMNIEGSWRFSNINDYFGDAAGNMNDWDWVSAPSKTGDDLFTIGMGDAKSINASTPHPEETAKYLTYMFSPETQGRLLAVCGKGPAPVHLREDAMEGLDERVVRAYAEISRASADDRYGYTTWTFWPPKSDVYIYEEVERVWTGEISVMDYLEGLDELFAEELASGDIPPIPSR